MGGEPYWYTVPYQQDVQSALDALRAREFAAGRYYPVLDFPSASDESPGAQHASIADALEAAAETGTRSILDIAHVRTDPDFCDAAPLTDDELQTLFGTTQPTRAQVLESRDLLSDTDRGHCRYVVLYENGTPSEIHFVGYSFD